jgi:hypothetical protein
MNFTSCATCISVSSIEKIDEGEVDRDRDLVGRGLGETYIDGCTNMLDSS